MHTPNGTLDCKQAEWLRGGVYRIHVRRDISMLSYAVLQNLCMVFRAGVSYSNGFEFFLILNIHMDLA
jgi:hypothetical protein